MAESTITAAPRPPAARRALEALEFPGCRRVTSRVTTSPTTKAELEFEPDTRAVNTCRMCLPTGAGGCTRSS